jgi:uncharacterized protein (TIGR02246 family)
LVETLGRLGDRAQIEDLLADYAYGVDANDLDLLVDLFTEDCVVEYGRGFGAKGQARLRDMMGGIPTFFAATTHLISNIVVRFDSDDEARVRAVVHAWHRYTDGRPDAIWLGYYADTVVRTETGWRIRTLQMQTTGSIDHHLPASRQIPFPRRT